jgi:Holliday junction resolvase RusA-like endonuclease
MIEFFVPGKAATAGSKKAFYVKKLKRAIITHDSKKTKPWMNTVKFFAMAEYQGLLLCGPVKLTMEFRRLRPKGHYGSGKNAHTLIKAGIEAPLPITKPDLTKLVRAAEDALKGVIWRDDSQVCIQETRKVYVDRDPGVQIQISEIIESKEVGLFGKDAQNGT